MKKLITLVTAAAGVFALAACGSDAPPKNETDTPVPGSTDSDGGSVTEVTVTLKNGKDVTCLVYTGYRKGGLSCDWEAPDD